MRRLIITLDDELSDLLGKYKNQSEHIRQVLQLYHSDITTDTIEGLRRSYLLIAKQLKEIDSKIDYLAGKGN